MPQDGHFDSDGARLHYIDWGGDGPPLILMHATMFFGGMWAPVVEALGHRFRIITPDQRGHGDSAKPDDGSTEPSGRALRAEPQDEASGRGLAEVGYSFETFARDLQTLIETLGLQSVVAAGHSSGGTTIALHAALYPGVIQRMVLLEPILLAPEFVARGPNPMADQARKRRPVWAGRQQMFDAYRTRPPFNTWREDILRLYVEGGTSLLDGSRAQLKCPPEAEARFYDAVSALDPWPYLERVDCPTLVAWAEHGRPAPMFDREAVSQAIAGSRTMVMTGVSHFAPMEKPEEVAALIDEFLLSP